MVLALVIEPLMVALLAFPLLLLLLLAEASMWLLLILLMMTLDLSQALALVI